MSRHIQQHPSCDRATFARMEADRRAVARLARGGLDGARPGRAVTLLCLAPLAAMLCACTYLRMPWRARADARTLRRSCLRLKDT